MFLAPDRISPSNQPTLPLMNAIASRSGPSGRRAAPWEECGRSRFGHFVTCTGPNRDHDPASQKVYAAGSACSLATRGARRTPSRRSAAPRMARRPGTSTSR